MGVNIALPENNNELRPKIIIMGIGGAGGNAINNMVEANIEGVDFWVMNTDAQALKSSYASNKRQLGMKVTSGLGAGSNPEIGRLAAQESKEQIEEALQGCHMLFITAGMGGGTGTGAAPVIAKIAKELDILTVGVVTKPFHFEGGRRMKIAELGLEELSKQVDTLIVIPNQNLFRVANEKTTFIDAFKQADTVLRSGVTSITDLIVMPGLINLDFADITSVMSEMGKAVMGTGESDDEDRAIKASEAAISNPILDHASMKGAKGVLINITGGEDMTLFEVDAAANRIKEEVDPNANIIFGSTFDKDLSGKIRVSVVATGINTESFEQNAGARGDTIFSHYDKMQEGGGGDDDAGISSDKGVGESLGEYASDKERSKLFLEQEVCGDQKQVGGSVGVNYKSYYIDENYGVAGFKVGESDGDTLRDKQFFIPPKVLEPYEDGLGRRDGSGAGGVDDSRGVSVEKSGKEVHRQNVDKKGGLLSKMLKFAQGSSNSKNDLHSNEGSGEFRENKEVSDELDVPAFLRDK